MERKALLEARLVLFGKDAMRRSAACQAALRRCFAETQFPTGSRGGPGGWPFQGVMRSADARFTSPYRKPHPASPSCRRRTGTERLGLECRFPICDEAPALASCYVGSNAGSSANVTDPSSPLIALRDAVLHAAHLTGAAAADEGSAQPTGDERHSVSLRSES
jgi:hypothetical protein